MTSLFEMSVADRSEAVFDKSVLLVKDDGSANTHEEQTNLTNPEELTKIDGWMRATAPNGIARKWTQRSINIAGLKVSPTTRSSKK